MSSEMKLSLDECARIYQMLKNMTQQMTEMTMEMRHMNSRIATLKNSSSSFTTIASIMNAPAPHQSGPHTMTASAPATASAPTTASASATASDSVSAMIIQTESIVSAFVASASVSTVASVSLATQLVFTPVKFIRRDITLLRNQLLGARNSATLVDLQAKTRHFCKVESSFKLAIQGGHIEGEYTRLCPVNNRVPADHD
jgi:hypothetical protein